jgi:broad specificity phosphatase PhoE
VSVPRLILLRHGEVASHRGDVPITEAGRRQAAEAGRRLGALGSVRLLAGATRRARETAEGVADGLRAAGAAVTGPEVAFALRNPDLYLAGARVDMVSSPEAFAEQVPWLAPDDVLRVPFFAGFLTAPDRITYWLRCSGPPGDDACAVAARIVTFARSLADGTPPDTVVAVTHSPVLRAVAVGLGLDDPGEPPYLTGYEVTADPAAAREFDPFT